MAIERGLELEDLQEAMEGLSIEEMLDIRLRYESAGNEVVEALKTIYSFLQDKGVLPSECCKMIIYGGLVSLMAAPEYKPSNP